MGKLRKPFKLHSTYRDGRWGWVIQYSGLDSQFFSHVYRSFPDCMAFLGELQKRPNPWGI